MLFILGGGYDGGSYAGCDGGWAGAENTAGADNAGGGPAGLGAGKAALFEASKGGAGRAGGFPGGGGRVESWDGAAASKGGGGREGRTGVAAPLIC